MVIQKRPVSRPHPQLGMAGHRPFLDVEVLAHLKSIRHCLTARSRMLDLAAERHPVLQTALALDVLPKPVDVRVPVAGLAAKCLKAVWKSRQKMSPQGRR